MLLVYYYRLYITYTLARGFLFNLDQSNICSRDIQKIEPLVITRLPIPQKIYNITKRLRTFDEIEKYFPAGFLSFIDSIEQQIPRPKNKMKSILFWKEDKAYSQEPDYG